jgi:hypothetical protein
MLKVAPEWISHHIEWLTQQGELWYATEIIHEWVRTADLSDPVNSALACSAVDDTSIEILEKRVESGDEQAAEVLRSIREAVDGRIPYSERHKHSDTSPERKESESIDYEAFPPSRISELLEALRPAYSRREILVAEWVEFWGEKNQVEDLIAGVNSLTSEYVAYDFFHPMFKLIRSRYGATRAFPWLIKAHSKRSWHPDYWGENIDLQERWQAVRDLYPKRWLELPQTSLLKFPEWSDPDAPIIYGAISTLVEYCIAVEHVDVALAVARQFIDFIIQYADELHLPQLNWLIHAER